VSGILSALTSFDTDTRHVVAIADAEANLLWVAGNDAALEPASEMRFEAGAAWGEAGTGTNAVGTAAAIDHAVQIFSAEHLVAAVHESTCSGAPIHDPVTGELIGVIDLTAELRTAHPHTLSLAALAARRRAVRRRGTVGCARSPAGCRSLQNPRRMRRPPKPIRAKPGCASVTSKPIIWS